MMGSLVVPSAVRVEVGKGMMPGAWIAYDARGRAIGCGVIGIGSRDEPSVLPAAKIVCHQGVFDRLMSLTKAAA